MKPSRISLKDALAEGDLSAFVDQAEREGWGTASGPAFDHAVECVIAPPPEGRTSRSPAGGGSRET